MSGEITVTPGKTFADGELVTYAKLNQLGQPLARLNEDSVGERELIEHDIRQLVPPLYRNILMNGNFDVWERGGFSNSVNLPDSFGDAADEKQFTADRWISVNVTNGVNRRSITRETFTVGQIAVPNEPNYFLRYTQLITDAGSTLGQPIEDVRTMSGKRVTLTWWMKSSDYSGAIGVQLEQHFAPDDLADAVIVAADSGGSPVLVMGASWVKYTAIFDIPSLVETTILGDNCLMLRFLLPTGTWTIDFSQVQLEEGDGATSFEYRPFLDELTRCQRYFEYHGGWFSDDTTNVHPSYYFAVRKYRAPDLEIIFSSGTSGTVIALGPAHVGYYQNVANSEPAQFNVTADADIYQ